MLFVINVVQPKPKRKPKLFLPQGADQPRELFFDLNDTMMKFLVAAPFFVFVFVFVLDVANLIGNQELSFYFVRATKCSIKEVSKLSIRWFCCSFCYIATDTDCCTL